MNSGLTSTLSEFTKRSDFSKSPLATEPPNEPPLHPSELSLIARARLRLGKVIPFGFVRFLAIFFIGVVATLAWQSHGDAARATIASWSPRLGWLAPAAAPVAAAAPVGAFPDRLKAASLALAAVRQSVDKLAAEITKLQAAEQRALERTSAPAPSPGGGPARKPAPPTQPPSRTPPTR